MIKRLHEGESLHFETLDPSEKKQKGILGRLYGKVASCVNPTRNERLYTDELWEQLFESDLIRERFENGGIFGQLNHPDYEEVDMSKIAIVMPEPPKKDSDGDLVAYVDILDTPCGRIAYQLAKYGYKFGISSRGTGDLIEGVNGEEVDPSSYQLHAFDLVEIPAVQSARLQFVESFDSNKTSLKQQLTEELNKASDADKVIMREALESMNIKLNESLLWKKDANGSMVEYKIISCHTDEKGKRIFKVVDRTGREGWVSEEEAERIEKGSYTVPEEPKPEKAAKPLEPKSPESTAEPTETTGVTGEPLVKLDDSLKEEANPTPEDTYADLAKVVKDNKMLQNDEDMRKVVEKTYAEAIKNESRSEARSDTEVLSEEVVNDKSEIKELQESLLRCRQLEKDNLSLQEKLSVCNAKEVKLEEELNRYKTMAASVSETAHSAIKSSKQLKDLQEKYNTLVTESESNKKLIEKLQTQDASNSALIEELQKQVASLTESLAEESSKANASLKESVEKIKKYQKALKTTREKYVEAKASAYGISKDDVMQNLNESYKLTDVDSICEKLSDRNRSLSKLPFRVGSNTKIVESVKTKSTLQNEFVNDDDVVSDSLLQMLNL